MSAMTMNEFLDRYIEGVPGSYYFCIEVIWGREISGGQFFYKKDARDMLLGKLVNFLDDPSKLLETQSKRKKVS